MRRIEARLVATFEGKMGGDNSAVLEDTDFVGKDVDIEDATAGGPDGRRSLCGEAMRCEMLNATASFDHLVGAQRDRAQEG